MTSFPLARQNGRTIDRATTDERVSPSQTSANNVQKQCPRRQNGRLERAGRLRTGHRRFRRHTVSKTSGFPPHTDGQGCEGLFSHLPAVRLLSCGGGVTFFPSTHTPARSLRRRRALRVPCAPVSRRLTRSTADSRARRRPSRRRRATLQNVGRARRSARSSAPFWLVTAYSRARSWPRRCIITLYNWWRWFVRSVDDVTKTAHSGGPFVSR